MRLKHLLEVCVEDTLPFCIVGEEIYFEFYRLELEFEGIDKKSIAEINTRKREIKKFLREHKNYYVADVKFDAFAEQDEDGFWGANRSVRVFISREKIE